jgi:hypothetical protein
MWHAWPCRRTSTPWGDGDVGEAIVVEGESGPVRLSYKRLHARSLLTLVGEVGLTRVRYAAPGRDSVHVLSVPRHPAPGRIETPVPSSATGLTRICGRASN